jgi:hypothetical protein
LTLTAKTSDLRQLKCFATLAVTRQVIRDQDDFIFFFASNPASFFLHKPALGMQRNVNDTARLTNIQEDEEVHVSYVRYQNTVLTKNKVFFF